MLPGGGGEAMKAARATRGALTTQLRQENAVLRGLMAERGRILVGKSKEHARALLVDFGKAYDVYARHSGPEVAMSKTVRGVFTKMRGMRPEGARILGNNVLAWAREQARKNPALQKQVDWLESHIKRSFARTGRHVQIVNGQILTGSKREWGSIATAMTGAAERARQEVSAKFTAIQQRAVGSLVAMGFSRRQAAGLVANMEAGRPEGTRRAAAAVARAGPGVGRGSTVLPGGHGDARGGRIGGVGLRDTVPIAPGHLAAPGELIVNRHTERRVNALLAMFGTRLGDEVAHERRPHYAAQGARVGGGGDVDIQVPRSALAGVPGALSNAAGDLYAKGMSQRLNKLLEQWVGPGGGGPGAGVSGSNQRMARIMMARAGWDAAQWPALKALWTGESGFSETARNPSSGAYGIPQALPPGKMGAAAQGSGPGAARAQIAWGLNYIKGRYGSPSGAYAAWQGRSPHWYATGGRMPEWGGWYGGGGSFTASRPTLIGVGDRGREQVTVTPHGGGGGSRMAVTIHVHNADGNTQAQIERALLRVARELHMLPLVEETG
jgi:hypothetical protein